MKKTKIICTLGPASTNYETIKAMALKGMNVARLNFSHGTHESHKIAIDLVKKVRKDLNIPIAILLDTKGPEIRLGLFKNNEIELKSNDKFILTTKEILGDNKKAFVKYTNFPKIVKVGTQILLNDGFVELKVVKIQGNEVETICVNGGKLSNNKSINLPDININTIYLSEKDKADIKFGIQEGVDIIALSFVNSKKDVDDVRKFLAKNGGKNIFLVSKIESKFGVDNLDEIIDASDGVMVARGDLGIEIGFEIVPEIQKKIIYSCIEKGKTVITATQMLETMTTNYRPTRAEISDVANAIYDGTSCIMLSGESAVGVNPPHVVEVMAKIATIAEQEIDYDMCMCNIHSSNGVSEGIGYSACALASTLDAKAIIVSTKTGLSAKEVSRFRAKPKILALTPNEKTYYQMAILWNVYPIMDKIYSNTDDILKGARTQSLKSKMVQKGDQVVQTAGITKGDGANLLVVENI